VKKLIALCMMVALLAPPAAVLGSQTTVPNGISRIGAENTSGTPLDYSSVGVAVIDTGIDLANPDLNVVGGVDCTGAGGAYSAGSIDIEGGQRSIWEPVPDDNDPDNERLSGEVLTNPDTGAISFAELKFDIQSEVNPNKLIGSRVNVKGYDDGNGHGTHVSGIIGARDDGNGVVGVAPNASLYSVRVLDANGSGSLDNLICGLDWVAQNADIIDVANMSLGAQAGQVVMDVVEQCESAITEAPAPYVQPSSLLRDELHEAVCRVTDAGVVLFAAAGNGWGDAATIVPGGYPEVVTVSSFADFDGKPGGLAVDTDPDPDINTVSACPQFGGLDDAFFSHLNGAPSFGYGSFGGPVVDVAAPGVCVLSTLPGTLASLTGTSMATPHATGAFGRFLADEGLLDTTLSAGVQAAMFLSRAEEPDPDVFRDSDEWNEPIVRVS